MLDGLDTATEADRPTGAGLRVGGELRRALVWLGVAALGWMFVTGYLPARRSLRQLGEEEESVRAEILRVREENRSLRGEILSAREDPAYAEALERATGRGRLPGEVSLPGAAWVPLEGGTR
ncbi:MAG: hypothetical protein L0216_18820 [Planctomycetales bacterium]|nr:hypothetical protein [Planctomycetales bacterium]